MNSETPTHNLSPTFKEDNGIEISPHVSHGEVALKKPRSSRNSDVETRTEEGIVHFHRLGWKRLTIILIVEAIALGSLSLPAAFAKLGMITGIVICVGLGFAAIYAGFMIGEVKLKFPAVVHYADIGRLLFGTYGYWIFSIAFTVQLTLVVGSHCLTGALALTHITESGVCSLVFGLISAIILFILAIPPSFAEIAILGYIDFCSIILAIGITIIATGLRATSGDNSSSKTWSALPAEDTTFTEGIVAVANIAFAYAFAVAQPSFMDELHTPRDYRKSITALGLIQITIYTLTGALVYAFVGEDVQSPALLSTGPTVSKVAFGVALPVIFISGSINTTVVCRYIHGGIFRKSVIRYVNTLKGRVTWIGLVCVVTVFGYIFAELVPFFSELLAIISSLFVSGFSFYIPSIAWFSLLRDGKWHSKKTTIALICNTIVFVIGLALFGCGTYASISQVIKKFEVGSVGKPFGCAARE